MTSLHGHSDRSNLDAYLDDVLSASERAQMTREISVSRELQAEVELQSRIDESLRRSFSPATVPEELLAKLQGSPTPDRNAPRSHRRRLTLAVTALAAMLVWGVLGWQYLASRTRAPRYNPNAPLATIYESQLAAGFRPKWVCDDDREFASTFLTRQGQGLLLGAMPRGSKMVGLTYCGGISRYTTTMLARVGDAPVMVFVDRVSADTHPRLPPDERKLHLFRKELGSLVLYELTPLEQPRVMDYLYLADVPAPK
jgi:hypothetical protein